MKWGLSSRRSVRKLQFALVLGLLLVLTHPGSLGMVSNNQAPASLNYEPGMNFAITLINYDQSLVDTNQLENTLPQTQFRFLRYSNNYQIQFANDSYTTMVNNYIQSIATSSWTSDLNTTALKQQVEDFQRTSIFSKVNGTAIPAASLEDYLAANLPSTTLPEENLYHIFLFNLSRFDTQGNHWFNVTEYDLDSDQPRDWWRLEWDYPGNYEVRFPYSAFSQNHDLAMIDPTSHQWYLEWRQIWNTNVDAHPTYNQTLGEYIAGQDQQEKNDRVTDTLNEWSTDWINHIFQMYTGALEFGTSIEVQLATIYDSREMNQSDLNWIINTQEIVEETNKILRSTGITVVNQWFDVANDNFTRDFVADKELDYENLQQRPSPFANWTYYNGISVWNAIQTNQQVQENYFNDTSAEIVVRGINMLLRNASYAGTVNQIPWSGGLYTGLGGGQTITMLWELGRAFYPDSSRKAGLSKVMIHEIGHSIGLPHTFSSTFTSDFANDVMGYYPATSDYSNLVLDAYQRNALDLKILDLIDLYQEYATSDLDFSHVLPEVAEGFETVVDLHQAQDYLDGYNLTLELIMTLQEADPIEVSSTTSSSSMTSSSSSSTTTSSVTTQTSESSSQTTTSSTSNSSSTTSSTDSTAAPIILPLLAILPAMILASRRNQR